jgi:hypothetical protein
MKGVRVWVADGELVDVTHPAVRAGMGKFDARGDIACSTEPDQPLARCRFAVSRDRGDNAVVVVTRPDGRALALFFEGGIFWGASIREVGGRPGAQAIRHAGRFEIRIGDARYDVPDAVVFGGWA